MRFGIRTSREGIEYYWIGACVKQTAQARRRLPRSGGERRAVRFTRWPLLRPRLSARFRVFLKRVGLDPGSFHNELNLLACFLVQKVRWILARAQGATSELSEGKKCEKKIASGAP